MSRVLLLKCGTANPAVSARLGDYDRWFVQAFGGEGHHFEVWQAWLGEKAPRADSFDAVIATGSPLSVTAFSPWMQDAAGWLLDAAGAGVPVLGVCFGHQLLAHALGAHVARNPNGREIGTITCELTNAGAADPLFEGVRSSFAVQATHEDVVDRWPDTLRPLAKNANTALQAFAFGEHVRAVQFHPEIDAAAIKALIEARTSRLEAEARARGADPKEHLRALYAGIRPTPSGPQILKNFLRHFARR
ncbi:MAG: glutamine amidotransferase [Myxococcaceae bacterium]|nr:glutamine amidotransferase [Myxococcaceae bacterium]